MPAASTATPPSDAMCAERTRDLRAQISLPDRSGRSSTGASRLPGPMHRPHLPLALGATLLPLGALGALGPLRPGVPLAPPAGEPDPLFNGGVPARIDFGNDAFLSSMALAPDGS